MYDTLFNELGLTPSEKTVYLSLLELGETTRAKLVKHSKITGSKIYEVLERLQQKGLASIYLKNKVKHFRPQNPKQLINFIADRQEKLEEQKKEVQKILPGLAARFASSKKEQEVEMLIGLKSIRLFFQEQVEELSKGECNYVIGGTQGENDSHIVAFFRKIHIQREKKGIKTLMLYNKRQKKTVNKEYSTKEFPNTRTKFISHTSAVSINIHKNKVLILIFGKELTGIKITSGQTAKSFKEYFDLLWKKQ